MSITPSPSVLSHVASIAVPDKSPPPAAFLAANGFLLIPQLLPPERCATLSELVQLPITHSETQKVGSRCLLNAPWCQQLAQELRTHPALCGVLSDNAVAVQCTYFEKSLARNWIVPVHQDLSIPVLEKIEHPALSGWTEKEGQCFVHAPEEVLPQLLAVRVHLDCCYLEDGAVRVYAGSHRLGRIEAAAATHAKSAFAEIACTGDIGSALVMHPLTLHASSKASRTSRRRVLHFLFAPAELPFGLRWKMAI